MLAQLHPEAFASQHDRSEGTWCVGLVAGLRCVCCYLGWCEGCSTEASLHAGTTTSSAFALAIVAWETILVRVASRVSVHESKARGHVGECRSTLVSHRHECWLPEHHWPKHYAVCTALRPHVPPVPAPTRRRSAVLTIVTFPGCSTVLHVCTALQLRV